MIRSKQNLGFAWAVAVPAIMSGVTSAISFITGRKGGKQKEAATILVERLEPELIRNLQAYQASDRTESIQAAALANFDQAWAWLESPDGCGTAALGKAGRACLADRTRGGSHDWFRRYRDPIANDPDVQPDPPLTTQLSEEAAGFLSPILPADMNPATALIGLALVIGGLSL